MKKIIFTVLFLTLCSASFAQRYDVFRLSVGVSGGTTAFTVNDKDLSGKLKLGVGYGADLGFTVFFSQHFGIRTGLGFSAVNGTYNFDDMTQTQTVETYKIIDYTSTLSDPKISILTDFITIPLQVAFRTTHWYANLGMKVFIPVKNKEDFSYSNTETSAFLRGMGDITLDDPAASSLGCIRTGEVSLRNDKKPTTWQPVIALDGGYRFVKSDSFSWTVGLYAEYGFSNRTIEGSGVLMTPNDDGTVTKNVHPLAIDKLGYFGFGIKLRCDFGIKLRSDFGIRD